jgi:hypothetical protein
MTCSIAVAGIAETAGRAILEVYDTDFAVEAKADDSRRSPPPTGAPTR